MLLQDWFKKDLIRPGTRIKVIKADRETTGEALWSVPITATVRFVDDVGYPPVGFAPDDKAVICYGRDGVWWADYDWVEILHPEEDPMNTQQVTPSQEVTSE